MSKAKLHFEAALADTENLMWFHTTTGGDQPGKRAKYFQSLSKSAIILLCSAWESYVESVILEIAETQIGFARDASELPNSLKAMINAHAKRQKDEAFWLEVSGDGWRKIARQACLWELGNLHAPTTKAVVTKFATTLGVTKISDAWRWKAARNIDQRIDTLVKLRGDLAHATSSQISVPKTLVTNNINLVTRVVEATDAFLIEQRLFKRPKRVARKALVYDL